MRIKFLRDEIYESEGPNKGPKFLEGDVMEVEDHFGERWIRRGAAVRLDTAPETMHRITRVAQAPEAEARLATKRAARKRAATKPAAPAVKPSEAKAAEPKAPPAGVVAVEGKTLPDGSPAAPPAAGDKTGA